MSLREKLLDFKRRLSDRKMYSIVIVVIAAVSVWGIYQYKHAANLRQELDNQYNRAFFDMVGYVNNVDTLLMKSMIASTTTKTATTMQEAWRQANLAQTNLGQLPVSQPVLAKTSKFLTQVGDLAYSLNNQNMNGKPLSDEQYKTVEKLQSMASNLRNSLNDLQGKLTAGRIKWGELSGKSTSLFSKTATNAKVQQLETLDKTYQDYPKLIYDGPFSEHLVTAEARGLTGDIINIEQARQKAKDFFGADKVEKVEDAGKNDTGTIKTFSFTVTLKNTPKDQKASISITQKGGHAFWMLYSRPLKDKKLSVDQAKEIGRKFLEDHGYKNMKDTYYLSEDGSATINYAYLQNNVVVYSDLIKVKVALDTGEIIGLEAKGYLSAHTEREIAAPKITLEQAKKKINSRIKISSTGLAIIPTQYKTENYCFEFKGKLKDKDCIVYINAKTGAEEDILMIINTPNGILTM